jgi:hypothetical protein
VERQDRAKDKKVKAMLTGSTLVVVADGAIARFFRRARPGLRLENRLSAHEIAEERFLVRVADKAIELVRSENPSQLVLCAPPKALGILRGALSSDAQDRLTLSWGKDITKETSAEIDERLKELRV